ncbi:MAG: 1,2-phenylacetyl-CoA epoxidase subunit PaaC [Planctomycetota bacterium]|jgi:ring-1,2-phenylacetyl-CoA epoxidase subunit PaaC
MSELPEILKEPLVELLLALADDKLVLGHRNSDWTGLAPILEEDIAFSSLAQDEIAHAQAIYGLAATLTDRSADDLAFGRDPAEFRCAAIVELPDDFDWAFAICRQFFCDHFDLVRLRRMARSSYKPLADLAARLAAEEQVHVEHADAWIQRLGSGTEESHDRMQAALRRLTGIAASLVEPVEGQAKLEEAGVYPPGDTGAFEQWTHDLTEVMEAAGLTLAPERLSPPTHGGRQGEHTEHLEPLLDEMCEVYRLEPKAAW